MTVVASTPRPAGSKLGGALTLLLISILFHTTFLFSIFDIYFVSPVTRVDVRFGVGPNLEDGVPGGPGYVGQGLAKRVVLIVGDGLRADKLFQTYPSPPFPASDPLPALIPDSPHFQLSPTSTTPAPYIRSLISSHLASWGISHTRVPTESRPGHVALIGGMYEDVSAVTRGWQANPVNFDSVFNQSSHTFSFGSPDILPMFQDGALDGKVDGWMYGEEEEDFSKDATGVDLWVLEKLKELVQNGTEDEELGRLMRKDGTVFFLHLLGCDSTGHSYRPHGPEYHRNIRVVDWVIQQTEELLREFYGDDNGTAFVFTADHGMSSKGNHGDGELDNTRTPLVAWGAGVETILEERDGNDDYSETWGLAGKRKDVEQADVAVLMAVLAGLPIPANSAGRVPLDYLSATPSFKARAAFANANQVLAEFSVKSDSKKAHSVSFRPFEPLTDSAKSGTKSVEEHRRRIRELIREERFEEAKTASMSLLKVGLEGVRYFQTYDWFTLRTVVTVGYLGFMIHSLHFIRTTYSTSSPSGFPASTRSLPITFAILTPFIALVLRFLVERSPPSYYLYAFFPAYFLLSTLTSSTFSFSLLLPSSIFRSALVLGVLQTMVFGYTRREVFAAVLLAMAWIWPELEMDSQFKSETKQLVWGWRVVVTVLSIFPCLPSEKGENLVVVTIGGVIFLIQGMIASNSLNVGRSKTAVRTKSFIKVEMALILGCIIITYVSGRSLQLKRGLPPVTQISGWAILISTTIVPFIHRQPSQPFSERLVVLLLSFAPAFIILSLSYEGLFYAVFVTALGLWIEIERKLDRAGDSTGEGEVSGRTVRIALFFLTFLHVGFFGVGNIASISSFYLEPVYRLIPIFAPFPMALLLLYKLLTPFFALSLLTTTLSHSLRLPRFSLFIIASTLTDVLTINFFFLVTDQGSWLEIGTTISNFAICSLLGIFNTILWWIGERALSGCDELHAGNPKID